MFNVKIGVVWKMFFDDMSIINNIGVFIKWEMFGCEVFIWIGVFFV